LSGFSRLSEIGKVCFRRILKPRVQTGFTLDRTGQITRLRGSHDKDGALRTFNPLMWSCCFTKNDFVVEDGPGSGRRGARRPDVRDAAQSWPRQVAPKNSPARCGCVTSGSCEVRSRARTVRRLRISCGHATLRTTRTSVGRCRFRSRRHPHLPPAGA